MKICCVVMWAMLCHITYAEDLLLPVISVYDGDTIVTRLTLPSPLDVVSVRIYSIDTPEKPADSYHVTGKLGRAQCVAEAELAISAKDLVRHILDEHGNMIIAKKPDWGKYGGRIVADVFAFDRETGKQTNIADELIKRGLAVEYFGAGAKKDWCAIEF